jgi:single-stranded-DNA-specific exonuclease
MFQQPDSFNCIQSGTRWVPRSFGVNPSTSTSIVSALKSNLNSNLKSTDKLVLPRLVREILTSRGITNDKDVQCWLSPSLKTLRDPFVLKEMDKAVERLLEVLAKQEPLVVYADYDLDGTSGLALLLKAFELLGFKDVVGYQPKRLSDGYGLHSEAIQRLYQDQGRRVLISVDLGITAIEEVDYANSLGMDVIITDHHLPKEILPRAIAVVNPNRGNCESQLSHLCGTGVAFYLVLALRRTLIERGLLAPEQAFDPKILLDCFVIGTVTDMVPLIEENRVLVKHGLLQLAQTKRPGLRVLMQALGLWGNPLTSQDVAIRFAPKLNALSRMEMGVQPIDLYLVEDEEEAHRLVEIVLVNNQTRQLSQRQAEAEAMRQLESYSPKGAVFVYSDQFHRGVVGLVATKLSQEFGLPAFVGSLSPEDGLIVGSARMPDGTGLNVLDAMGAASEILNQFGGHAAAAGFELKSENADRFRSSLEEYFIDRASRAGQREIPYDVCATLEELDASFMTWYGHMSPFGVQFVPPVFRVQNVKIEQIKVLKGGHYRLTLSEFKLSVGATSEAATRTALWFAPPKNHPLLSAQSFHAGQKVDLLLEPQWNYFAGKKSLQFLVQDLCSSKL